MLLTAAGSSTPFARLVYAMPMVGKLRCYARAVCLASFALSFQGMENLQLLEQTQRLLSLNVQEALALEVGLLRLKL